MQLQCAVLAYTDIIVCSVVELRVDDGLLSVAEAVFALYQMKTNAAIIAKIYLTAVPYTHLKLQTNYHA